MQMDYEVYIYHPCLLSRAQNSQPWMSCGLPSVLRSLPFGLRVFRQINAALVLAELAPQIHKTFSPVSRLGTRRCTRRSRSCHTLSSRPWAERQNLVYGFSGELALRQVGNKAPLSPSLGLSQRAETALLRTPPAFLPRRAREHEVPLPLSAAAIRRRL